MSSRELNGTKLRGFRTGARTRRGDLLLVAALICAVLGVGGLYVWHRVSVAAAHARIEANWRTAQGPMIARLKQGHPLQYGDVWATHSTLVCGFVNGWGSFGGLSAMTPFYVWKAKPFFALDMTALAFSPGWRECLDDHWVDLVSNGRPVARR
jgi:hypothetical protein